MPKKISEEKQNLIRKRLHQGCTIEEITQELQVNEKTVRRYKKNLPPAFHEEQGANDPSIRLDYTKSLTKVERAYAEKIEKELALFEDDEEGWTYHITKHDIRRKQSGLWWNMIVYPESAPPNWINVLKARGYTFAVSPLHDKDSWSHDSPEMVNAETGEIIPRGTRYKKGDLKKAHWHVIVITDTRVGYMEMNGEMQKITHCPYIQKCRSLRNSYEYFLHINAPDKYQDYKKDDIQSYNNFHIEPNKYETGLMQAEIVDMMLKHDLDSYTKVLLFYNNQPEYQNIILRLPTSFKAVAADLWRDKHPDGKIQKVEIVNPNK